jgi:hypothetical protein
MTAPGMVTAGATAPGARASVAAWLLIQVAEGWRAAVAAALNDVNGVHGWQGTTGSYDFIVEVAGGEPGPLAALTAIRALAGIGHVVCCRPSHGGDALGLP